MRVLSRRRPATGPAGASPPAPLPAAAVVDVETDVGSLFSHADDAVLRPALEIDKRWEPDESDFLRSQLRPGSVFVDVGANIGYMSVLGARACGPSGRVVAVEPEPRNAALLEANLWRHGLVAEVIRAAAYSRRGFLHLTMHPEHPGDHQVHDGPPGEETRLVPCLRLDDHLAGGRVDVVKIDTQGTDHEVIDGLAGVLDANPSVVMIAEFWLEGMEARAVDPDDVLHRYRAHGYRIGLLGERGCARAAGEPDVIAACEAWGGRYVNVVLLGPAATAPPGWDGP